MAGRRLARCPAFLLLPRAKPGAKNPGRSRVLIASRLGMSLSISPPLREASIQDALRCGCIRIYGTGRAFCRRLLRTGLAEPSRQYASRTRGIGINARKGRGLRRSSRRRRLGVVAPLRFEGLRGVGAWLRWVKRSDGASIARRLESGAAASDSLCIHARIECRRAACVSFGSVGVHGGRPFVILINTQTRAPARVNGAEQRVCCQVRSARACRLGPQLAKIATGARAESRHSAFLGFRPSASAGRSQCVTCDAHP